MFSRIHRKKPAPAQKDFAGSPLRHFLSGHPLSGPFPKGFQSVSLGMGCFWGAERLFWSLEGVHVTAAGYQGGFLQNPSYEQVCSGRSGHVEVVRIIFDPLVISFEKLLKVFWENHDPTQGMRQGNDVGSQYRSAIFTSNRYQQDMARQSRDAYEAVLKANGFGPITTEIADGEKFYPAEEYHQQYLAKNPNGYCGLKGSGVDCPLDMA